MNKMDILTKEIYLTDGSDKGMDETFVDEIAILRAKHPLKPEKGKSALLILDMQKFFLLKNSHAFIPSAASIVGRIKRIKDRCEGLNIPVIFTRHMNSPENAGNMNVWWRDILTEEDPESELIDELSDPGNIVIEKSQYNAFYKTDLENILIDREISQLIISGVMTHLCCETTAREAYVRGFDVFFGIDFTATYNRNFHTSTLRNLAHGFAVPLLTQELLEMLK